MNDILQSREAEETSRYTYVHKGNTHTHTQGLIKATCERVAIY